MKTWPKRLGLAALALAAGGLLVAASGIIPIKASSGHWPITVWFFRFGMHRSVSMHSLLIEVPPLDDRGKVLKGAIQYDIGCRPCHGGPEVRQPRIAQEMTPPPPYLPPVIERWDPEELFYLVKHGVKFTGMPAWPSQNRDDEVWSMVAFLLELPGLNEAEYQSLVHGTAGETPPVQTLGPPASDAQIPSLLGTCARCHGRDGLGRNVGAFPKLAGQRREYMQNALEAYARGERHSGIMEPIAAGLTDKMIQELTTYYAELTPPALSPPTEEDAEAIERGREIALHGIPVQRVPACIECHGSAGKRAKPAYPLLAGQPADYLQLQLKLFKQNQRGGSSYAHLMQHVAPHLEPEQMRQVALYFESLGPSHASGESASP